MYSSVYAVPFNAAVDDLDEAGYCPCPGCWGRCAGALVQTMSRSGEEQGLVGGGTAPSTVRGFGAQVGMTCRVRHVVVGRHETS